MALDSASLRILYDAMWMGDGHSTAHGTRIYNTVSERLAGDVQELLIRMGIAASIYSYPLSWHPYYYIRELRKRCGAVTSAQHIGWVREARRVWSVPTANALILVSSN